MRWNSPSRGRRAALGTMAAGVLLAACGCGGPREGSTVEPPKEHGKKNKDMEDYMKSQEGKAP